MFDKEYTSELFFDDFQNDKNISKLILIWTPELIDLIKIKLFQQLDINHDEIFNINDYFDIKQFDVNQLQISIFEILEEIRRTVAVQYNQFYEIMKKIKQQSGNYELDENDKETLEIMLENLPEEVKEKFKQNNMNVKDVLNKIKSKKSKRSSTNKQNKLTINENGSYRTDL
jgi:predicted transcriptional regulator